MEIGGFLVGFFSKLRSDAFALYFAFLLFLFLGVGIFGLPLYLLQAGLPLFLALLLVAHAGSDDDFYVLAVAGLCTIACISFGLVFFTPAVEATFDAVPSLESGLWPLTVYHNFGSVFLLGTDAEWALDSLSFVFILLTNFVMLVSLLVSRALVHQYYRIFVYVFLILHSVLLYFFCAFNLLIFYVLFEASLIPMFFIIGVWGSRERRTFAAYSFFLFTAAGSLVMLLGICYLVTHVPSLHYGWLLIESPRLALGVQLFLFFAFFLGFAVKIPMFPFHLWLPEAHVEAPTLGSIILAGILLKLGGYGMVRFLLPLFPQALVYVLYPLLTLCVLSVLYSAFIGLCQIDMKKIIAYSSVTHMNFAVAGLVTGKYLALQGGVYSMVSHGFISSALFLAVGVLYDRYHTRLLGYYGGIANIMPFFAGFLFFFVLANVGIPPLSGFVSEMAVLFGLAPVSYLVVFFLFLSSIFMTINFFWFYNRLSTGPVSRHISGAQEISLVEGLAFGLLALAVLLLGVKPALLFDYCDAALAQVNYLILAEPVTVYRAPSPFLDWREFWGSVAEWLKRYVETIWTKL